MDLNYRGVVSIFCSLLLPLTEIAAQQTFQKGNICTDSLEFNSAFSPAGESFYFSRSIDNKTRIFFAKKNERGWSVPTLASFNDSTFSDADAAFSPSGDLYFISNRPLHNADTTRDYNIWRVTLSQFGTWTQPETVKSLNSDQNEFYISFTKTGDAYFSSSRSGGFGEEDLYYARASGNEFETPVNLGPAINTNESEYDPFISANGMVIVFTSSGRKDSFGKADLYWTLKEGTSWGTTEHFTLHVNTATRDFCPYISGDEKFFYYSSEREIKVMQIDQLPDKFAAALKTRKKSSSP